MLLAFVHIPKTGGTTWNFLLRRHFGGRHLDVRQRPRKNLLYRADDLRRDLKLAPWIRSLSGHPLRPYVNFEEYESQLRWAVLFRDPTRRFISQYQHEVERHGRSESFEQWMKKYNRQNFHVRWLSGGQDLGAAKQILMEKQITVGFLESFKESLLMFRQAFGLVDFSIAYRRPRNQAKKGSVRRTLDEHYDRYAALVRTQNELDEKLYRFAKERIWPKQVEAYGAAQLQRDAQQQGWPGSGVTAAMRLFQSFVFRNALYKPWVLLDGWVPRPKEYRQGGGRWG